MGSNKVKMFSINPEKILRILAQLIALIYFFWHIKWKCAADSWKRPFLSDILFSFHFFNWSTVKYVNWTVNKGTVPTTNWTVNKGTMPTTNWTVNKGTVPRQIGFTFFVWPSFKNAVICKLVFTFRSGPLIWWILHTVHYP